MNPDIMAQIAQSLQAQQGGGQEQASPSDPTSEAGTEDQPDAPSPLESIQNAILNLHDAFDSDNDETDKAVYAKCLTALQGIMARVQKETQAGQSPQGAPGQQAQPSYGQQ